MSLTETVIDGTLRTDGTLELDEKPNLPAGRVKVVLRQETTATQAPSENWWQYMQRSRRELEQAGATFMNEADGNAHLELLRD